MRRRRAVLLSTSRASCSRSPPPRRPSRRCGSSSARACAFSSSTLRAISTASRRRCRRIRAGRSRRPGSAASAATTAGPTGAAGRAPRSRPEAARARARAFFDSVTRQHLDEDAIDVVLGLLLGQAQRVDLHAIAEPAVLGVVHAVARRGDLVPQLGEGAHLAHLGDEPQAGVDEERDARRRPCRSRPARPRRRPSRRRARRSRWRARRRVPAPASRRLPAGGRSRRWSGSTSAPRAQENTIVSLISRSDGSGGNT